MPTRAASILLAFVATACSSPTASEQTLPARLQALKQQLEATAQQPDPAPPAPADTALLERAHVDVDRFHPSDLAALVVMLRFAHAVGEDELQAIGDYGASAEGRELAGVLAFVLLFRDRVDDGARLLVVSSADVPADRRAYALWKRIEWALGGRPDYDALMRRLSLALLRRFELGDAAERAVVADLLGEEQMTEADLPALRARVEGR